MERRPRSPEARSTPLTRHHAAPQRRAPFLHAMASRRSACGGHSRWDNDESAGVAMARRRWQQRRPRCERCARAAVGLTHTWATADAELAFAPVSASSSSQDGTTWPPRPPTIGCGDCLPTGVIVGAPQEASVGRNRRPPSACPTTETVLPSESMVCSVFCGSGRYRACRVTAASISHLGPPRLPLCAGEMYGREQWVVAGFGGCSRQRGKACHSCRLPCSTLDACCRRFIQPRRLPAPANQSWIVATNKQPWVQNTQRKNRK